MKILGISCSRRPWGNTDILVHHALKGASFEGAEIRFLRLTDLETSAITWAKDYQFKWAGDKPAIYR